MAWSDHIDESLLDRLMAYVDDELAPKERHEVETLIEKDDKLRLVVMEMRETKTELSSMYVGLAQLAPPQELVDLVRTHPMPATSEGDYRVSKNLEDDKIVSLPGRDEQAADSAVSDNEKDTKSSSKLGLPLPAWSTSISGHQWLITASLACLLIGGGLGFQTALWTTSGPPTTVTAAPTWQQQVAQYHRVYASDSLHLVEIPAERKDHIQEWLSKRLGRPILVPNFEGYNLRFAGARQLVVNGQPVAQLMYLDADDRPLAFCITKMPMMGSEKPPTLSEDGDLTVVDWQNGGFGYIVLGWEDGEQLQQLAQEIKLLYSI